MNNAEELAYAWDRTGIPLDEIAANFIAWKNEAEDLKEKMYRIKTWCEAYPIEIFPEPDFKKAHEVLTENGINLDAISSSNMRHVLNGILEIIDGMKPDKSVNDICNCPTKDGCRYQYNGFCLCD